jgi:endonuclease/exonuclease/phosphatase family metal-dependent hydrolase
MSLRVLTWNLFHGRSVPETRRSLLPEFAATLAGWEWDVALLQEAPPWWPVPLGRAAGASVRMARTSRNLVLPLRRLVAERRPDLLGSWGGGANAILVRGQRVSEPRTRRLRLTPERRVVHGVRLEDGTWVSNIHAQAHAAALAQADLEVARTQTLAWARGGPAILGGDFNLRGRLAVDGFTDVAWHSVDHVLVHGLRGVTRGETLHRGTLSDHAPVVVTVDGAS